MKTFLIVGVLIVAGLGTLGAVENRPEYSFELESVVDGEVSFRGGDESSWRQVSYSGGWFLVSENGVRTAQPEGDTGRLGGILVKLSPSEDELSLSCRAYSCTVAVGKKRGAKERKLHTGESTTVQTKSAVKITILK